MRHPDHRGVTPPLRRRMSDALPFRLTLLLLFVGYSPSIPAASRHSGVSALPDQPSLVLVSPDVPPAAILYPAGADPREKQAAQQLAEYLTQISNKPFTADVARDKVPDRAIQVGVFAETGTDELSREGFLIRTNGQRISIRGGSPRATLYAVFALLEDQLGCRWWSHDEQWIPRRDRIEILAQATHIEPAFRIHDLFNREGQATANFFAYKRRGGSGITFTAVHNLCPLLKPHAEQHPDFLPTDKNGQRKFNNIHMNYTAAGMPEIVADALSREVQRRKGNQDDFFYFAGMGDWYGGMDFSPASQRIYEEELWVDADGRKKPGYCATMLRMVNRAAELLEQKHPGAIVATHAYMSLEAPPAKTRPRENVVIEIPRLRHDTVRSVEESEQNLSFRRNLERWVQIAPGRVYIWEYGTNFNNFLKPFPCLRSLAANIAYYHRIGVAGVRIQGNYVSFGGDLAVLKNYVWGKLLWDPTLEVDQLIAEFCSGYYGPAAEDMIAYVNLLENSVRGETPVSADEFETDFEKWLRPEVVREARIILNRAIDKTAGAADGEQRTTFHRRVLEAQVSLEAFELWTPAELIERGEQLIRADYQANTLPRARDLIQHCRQASPREWGDGRAYRMEFLKMHGGPLPALKAADVTVKIAPLQGGQIRSLLLGDVVAIDQSQSRLDPAARVYELTTRRGNCVDMVAELGIAHWGSNTKQIANRRITLGDDGIVRTDESIERAEGSRVGVNKPVIESIYECGEEPESIRIEALGADQQWTAVEVGVDRPRAEVSPAAQLRIIRHDRQVVIHDVYHTKQPTAAVVDFLPPEKERVGQIRVTVSLQEVRLTSDDPTTYLNREIRVFPLDP